jgi:glutathione S-transferase
MILLHHLRVGRSLFTVWLLEELGLDYELKIYTRNDKGRAQADLRDAHPLGKSPVIEDGELLLAESGAIASYLLDTYDTQHVLAPPRSDTMARGEFTQWLHYSEGSAFAPLIMKRLLMADADTQPPLITGFAAGEVDLQLGYINDFLGDKQFLLGDRLQGPDFGISYILEMANRIGELGPYPRLQAYLKRMTARPAFQRACERAGEWERAG